MGIVHKYTIVTDDAILRMDYHGIVLSCLNTNYIADQTKAVEMLRGKFRRYVDSRESLSNGLIRDIKYGISKLEEKIVNKGPDSLLVKHFKTNIDGARNILTWLENGRGDFNIIESDKKSEDKIFEHHQIFVHPRALELFLALYEEFKDTRYPLVDFSFIYRKLYQEELIHPYVRDAVFRVWLAKHCNIHIDKTKTLERCRSLHRETIFLMRKKEIFKI